MSKEVYERVTAEHEALWDNISKLQMFLDNGQPSFVSDKQWKLMKKQNKAMRKYNKILAERVNDLYEEAYGHHLKSLDKPTDSEINDALLQAASIPTNDTPGQKHKVGEDVDISNWKMQESENFMKDSEDDYNHFDNVEAGKAKRMNVDEGNKQ